METTTIILIAVIATVVIFCLIGMFFLVRSFTSPSGTPRDFGPSAMANPNAAEPKPLPPVKPDGTPWGDVNRGDQDQNRQEVCAEISGKLFNHPCAQYARYVCARCGKPVCHQHVEKNADGNESCLSCLQLGPNAEPDLGWRGAAWWTGTDIDIIDDRPTFYNPRKRQRQLERDRDDDFTDGDEAALLGDDDGFEHSGWENDMGAS